MNLENSILFIYNYLLYYKFHKKIKNFFSTFFNENSYYLINKINIIYIIHIYIQIL